MNTQIREWPVQTPHGTFRHQVRWNKNLNKWEAVYTENGTEWHHAGAMYNAKEIAEQYGLEPPKD